MNLFKSVLKWWRQVNIINLLLGDKQMSLTILNEAVAKVIYEEGTQSVLIQTRLHTITYKRVQRWYCKRKYSYHAMFGFITNNSTNCNYFREVNFNSLKWRDMSIYTENHDKNFIFFKSEMFKGLVHVREYLYYPFSFHSIVSLLRMKLKVKLKMNNITVILQ